MSSTLTTGTPRSVQPTRGVIFTILQTLAPLLFAVIAGYGAVRYAEGTTNQRIQNLEAQSKSQDEQLRHTNDKTITREEFQQFIDTTREDLREIKSDVRAIRSDLKR